MYPTEQLKSAKRMSLVAHGVMATSEEYRRWELSSWRCQSLPPGVKSYFILPLFTQPIWKGVFPPKTNFDNSTDEPILS